MEDQKTTQDPSVNVLRLVDDTTKYFENMLNQDKEFNAASLRLAVEASRREREAETKRIDNRWAEDKSSVSIANDRAIKQAELLNSQMLDNAEVLRKSVEATATAIATQFEKMTTQQNERIAALERVNSENTGAKSTAPDLQELVSQLITAQNIAKGREGLSIPILMMISGTVVGLIVFVLETIFA